MYDESRHALIGRDTGLTHRLGDVVEVRLVEVTPLAGGLRFELLSEGRLTQQPSERRPTRSKRSTTPGSQKRKPKAKTKGKARSRGRSRR